MRNRFDLHNKVQESTSHQAALVTGRRNLIYTRMELIGSPEGNKRGHKAATRRDLNREERERVHEYKEG
jgi:hypothetical protein